MRLVRKALVASLLAISASAASAEVIDFESVATGIYSSITTNGVTFTFTSGNGLFNVDDQSPGAPISGHNLISYFQNPGEGAFQATVAGGFTSFKIGCGDFNPSDDDECHLEAFDSAGGMLASSVFSQAEGHPGGGGYMTVSSITPIAYVRFYEVGSFAGAVYWDSVEFARASSVPEPTTLALLGLGLAGLAGLRRRRA